MGCVGLVISGKNKKDMKKNDKGYWLNLKIALAFAFIPPLVGFIALKNTPFGVICSPEEGCYGYEVIWLWFMIGTLIACHKIAQEFSDFKHDPRRCKPK